MWLVLRRDGGEVAVVPLDYGELCGSIEKAFPALHRDERDGLTRSGVERIAWVSNNFVQFQMDYNNASVVVTSEFSKGTLRHFKGRKGEQADEG